MLVGKNMVKNFKKTILIGSVEVHTDKNGQVCDIIPRKDNAMSIFSGRPFTQKLQDEIKAYYSHE